MKYLLLIYGNEATMEAYRANTPPDQQAAEAKVWYEYGDWLREKGWYLAGEALRANGHGDIGAGARWQAHRH